jgi:hypothetical protein
MTSDVTLYVPSEFGAVKSEAVPSLSGEPKASERFWELGANGQARAAPCREAALTTNWFVGPRIGVFCLAPQKPAFQTRGVLSE